MLLGIITPCKTCISKLSLQSYSRGFFRVSCLKAWTGVEFARGIFRHLCGRLKEAEQIKHTNFLLNFKVMFNSTVSDVRSPACVVVYNSAKLPGMVRTSLLCLIIDRHLSSRIISPLFWRPRATLPLWSDVMQTNMRFIYVYSILCVCVCVCWLQIHVSTSHAKEWGLSFNISDRALFSCSVLYKKHKTGLFFLCEA